MPRHKGLPRPSAYILSKPQLLKWLQDVDSDNESRQRVLHMENDFRERITQHLTSLPTADARLQKFNTNPFVLMFHCLNRGYSHIHQIEEDILPAKVFMSMETSAGRMAEIVTLPIFSWQTVESAMQSTDSVLDGRCLDGDVLKLATLKSGPRCLNDEMSKDIADDIIRNCQSWAEETNVQRIDFTYGVLYGTRKLSNKKDWHILRNVGEKLATVDGAELLVSPDRQWFCQYTIGDLTVDVTVRIGVDLWNYIGGHDLAFMEVAAALIRACVVPSDTESEDCEFTISDLRDIVSLDVVPKGYNVSILQRKQLSWLFFFARHFCDDLAHS